MNDEVLDAMEDVLRQEGVFDEMKKTLFLAVSRVVKKQKPIEKASQVKEFASTKDGKYALLLIADLLEKLEMKNCQEIFALESGFTPTASLKSDLHEKFGGKFSSTGGPMLQQIVAGTVGDMQGYGKCTEDKHGDMSPRSPSHDEMKHTPSKKNKKPISLPVSPPSKNSSFDLEGSFDADEKSPSSTRRPKKNSVSPLGPSPPKKSPLAPLSDVKGLTNALPPLGASSVDSVIPAKHSPLSKHASSSRALSNDELSHDSLSSKRRYDHLEDSFEQSVDEKLEESKDGFEVSDSFENSDFNTSVKLDSPLSKQSSHVLAPLGDVLSPYSAKSDREDKSFALDDSQPEELASASFLEESEVSDTSNMFDNEDCVVLDEPKKSDSGPSETSREREKQYSPGGPATEELEGGNVNLSTASTVHLMRSQVGWGQDDDKGRPGDDFQYKEAGDAGRDNMDEGFPGRNRRSGGDGVRTHQSAQNESKVDSFDENSDFDSIEDIDQYDDEADDKGVDLNVSYRSNQEEDEEENKRLNASREDERNKQANDASNNASSGSLFSRSDNKKKEDDVPLKVDKSLNETDDYEDDYGDDFDDDDFEKEDEGEGAQLDESIAESIAESLEEDFDDDDNLSFGSNGDDSDKEKSYMSSPSHSPSGKLPSLFSKTNPPLQEHKTDHSFDDSHDSDDPFQDKSASFDEDGPETSLVSKDDLEDFSVGEESSSGDEFLKDEDDESNSHNNLSVVKGSVGRLGESNEFSMSENEISGSHNLNEFGVDYTTSAAPPAGRRGGW